MRLAVDRALLGTRRGLAHRERAGHAEEAPLDADRVGIDEDEIAGLESSVGRFSPPRVRVGTGADGGRREILAPAPDHHVGEHGEHIALRDAGRDRCLERGQHLHDQRPIEIEQLDLRRCLHPARLLGDGRRVAQSHAALDEREERRCAEPIDRDALTPRTELAHGGERLVRPGRRLWRGVVVELPRMHRTHVGSAQRRPMHRVRVLEQDRRTFLRHDRAAGERAHGVHGHRGHAGRVSHVGLVREQEHLDVMVAHRPLQPVEPLDAEPLEVDVVSHGNAITPPRRGSVEAQRSERFVHRDHRLGCARPASGGSARVRPPSDGRRPRAHRPRRSR